MCTKNDHKNDHKNDECDIIFEAKTSEWGKKEAKTATEELKSNLVIFIRFKMFIEIPKSNLKHLKLCNLR